MKSKYPWIKVNVTPSEKEKIELMAQSKGMSASAFVKEQLEPFLEEEEQINVATSPSLESRDRYIIFQVSESEHQRIKELAGDKTISSYLRKVGLNGTKTINIEVYDDDIVDLEHRIAPKIDQFISIIKALRMQNQLHDNQYQKLESLLLSISEDTKAVATHVYKNRLSIRRTRLRELRRNTATAIKTEQNYLAQFNEEQESED